MSPHAFLQKPLRWLQAVQRFGANASGGPCFAYGLCTRRIAANEARKLDLSCWRTAYCGAEPIRLAVLHTFAECFAPAEFRRSAFLPCYGLAETTLIATATKPGAEVRAVALQRAGKGSRDYVSCGTAVPGCRVEIRNGAADCWATPGTLGEIHVSGPHVSPGIWRGEENPPAPFPGTIADAGVSYLPTGDLGLLVDDELVPIDRLKDLIAVYGTKVHAIDIETTLLEQDSAVITAAAAFAVDQGDTEHLVALCEVRRELAGVPDLADLLAKQVAEAHGILPQIGLVPIGILPRTSSGKIMRFECKARFLLGQFAAATIGGRTHVLRV